MHCFGRRAFTHVFMDLMTSASAAKTEVDVVTVRDLRRNLSGEREEFIFSQEKVQIRAFVFAELYSPDDKRLSATQESCPVVKDEPSHSTIGPARALVEDN